MIIHHQRITIISSRTPARRDINAELQWFGESLGLFNLRDKDKSRFRIFIELLKSTKAKTPLSSDQLAANLGLSRGTVIHHINNMMEQGLVVTVQNKYLLRVDNLEDLVGTVENDVARICADLRRIAKEIDEQLRL